MNTPNPLVPQGTLERTSKGKSTVRIAIFTIISIHAVFFAGLLMQGCRRDEVKSSAKTPDVSTNQNALPALDAGYYPATQDIAQPSTSPTPAVTNAPGVLTSEPAPALPTAVSPEPPPADGKTYIVAKGDTLTRIAKANGVTVGAITRANPHSDLAKIKPGQKLQIPAPAAAPAGATGTTAAIGFKEPATMSAASTGKVHIVKAGETLTRIAKHYGTSPKALRATNNLKSDKLYAGQKLKVPAHKTGAAATEDAKTAALSKSSATNPVQATTPSSSGATTNLR